MEEKTTPTREEELARREALLAQREAQLEKEQAAFEAAKAQDETRKKKLLDNNDPDFVNPKEKLYDKFPLTVHQMDRIIGVLFALILLFLVLVIGLIVGQNFVAIGLSKVLGISPLVGLCTGSIPMVGGHGTAGAFGPMLEGFGVRGATTLCTAAATYGLIAGSMMGGPVGKTLIEKHDLLKTVVPEDDSLLVEDEIKHERHASMYPPATFQIIIAMGIGTIVSRLLSLTGMTFPVYIGAMIAAACIRNIGEYSGAYVVYMGEINDIGGISLSLFLGMAMITLKLWQLADLAGPLVVLLAGQTVFILLYVVLVVFNVMGRDYDAAVLVSGTCGFGMGATPNAMANMQVVCEKYAPSIKAYLIIPLVGSLFADFLNSLAITLFINLI